MPSKRSNANNPTPTPSASSIPKLPRAVSPAAASPETTAASTKPSTAVSTKPPSSSSASLKSSSVQNSTGSNAPSSLSSSRGTSSSSSNANSSNAQDILQAVWSRYTRDTPQRVKLLDVFMAFLVVVGGLQFVYCVVAGNYPFNAFLSGFSATVGQFVLTASLRIQTNPENKAEFTATSDERAFADYVFGSLLLHFFCVNFIN